MDTTTYFRSLTDELHALKNRVRNFIDDAHWQTDGEWKESVLRACLRRCLPSSVVVGRGFVVSPDATSDQIDILIYSADKPVLFRDGDLAFITHDALLGMIEVKTSVNNRTYGDAIAKLADNAERVIPTSRSSKIVGLFAYDNDGITAQGALEHLKSAAHGQTKRVVDISCLGCDMFTRWWDLEPRQQPGRGRRPAKRWHAYHLQSMAAGYFIHNIIECVAPESVESNQGIWFPLEGKEVHLDAQLALE